MSKASREHKKRVRQARRASIRKGRRRQKAERQEKITKFIKAREAGLNKRLKQTKSNYRNALAKIKASKGDIKYIALLPFKKMMRIALRKKDVPHTKHLSDIVPKFYLHIVQNKNFGASLDDYNYMVEGHAIYNIDAAAVAQVSSIGLPIITAIIDFIKSLKKKKDAGEPLTDMEKTVLEYSERASETVLDAAEKQAQITIAEEVRDFLFSWKGAVTLGVIGIVAFLGIRGIGR